MNPAETPLTLDQLRGLHLPGGAAGAAYPDRVLPTTRPRGPTLEHDMALTGLAAALREDVGLAAALPLVGAAPALDVAAPQGARPLLLGELRSGSVD